MAFLNLAIAGMMAAIALGALLSQAAMARDQKRKNKSEHILSLLDRLESEFGSFQFFRRKSRGEGKEKVAEETCYEGAEGLRQFVLLYSQLKDGSYPWSEWEISNLTFGSNDAFRRVWSLVVSIEEAENQIRNSSPKHLKGFFIDRLRRFERRTFYNSIWPIVEIITEKAPFSDEFSNKIVQYYHARNEESPGFFLSSH